MEGIVKWFNQDRGFGFITPSDGSVDVFVHYSDITDEANTGRRNLSDGEKVEFEITTSDRGPRASQVKVLQ